MDTEALPNVEQTPAANAIEVTAKEIPEGEQVEQTEVKEVATEEKKPEKTPEQREIERLRRGIDRRTRQLSEARAQLGLTQRPIESNNQTTASDSEPLSLTRAELAQIVNAEAKKLAPTLAAADSEAQKRQGVIHSLAKTWGQERFDEVAADLDLSFGGLSDAHGRPKPATEAIFESDNPAAVIEYLAHPDHEDEAERISKMSASQAGRAIAKLEMQFSADVAKPKPIASKAPAPLESIRGQGKVTDGLSDDLTAEEWWKKRTEQLRNRKR